MARGTVGSLCVVCAGGRRRRGPTVATFGPLRPRRQRLRRRRAGAHVSAGRQVAAGRARRIPRLSGVAATQRTGAPPARRIVPAAASLRIIHHPRMRRCAALVVSLHGNNRNAGENRCLSPSTEGWWVGACDGPGFSLPGKL